jgi:hypothetical protein
MQITIPELDNILIAHVLNTARPHLHTSQMLLYSHLVVNVL